MVQGKKVLGEAPVPAQRASRTTSPSRTADGLCRYDRIHVHLARVSQASLADKRGTGFERKTLGCHLVTRPRQRNSTNPYTGSQASFQFYWMMLGGRRKVFKLWLG